MPNLAGDDKAEAALEAAMLAVVERQRERLVSPGPDGWITFEAELRSVGREHLAAVFAASVINAAQVVGIAVNHTQVETDARQRASLYTKDWASDITKGFRKRLEKKKREEEGVMLGVLVLAALSDKRIMGFAQTEVTRGIVAGERAFQGFYNDLASKGFDEPYRRDPLPQDVDGIDGPVPSVRVEPPPPPIPDVPEPAEPAEPAEPPTEPPPRQQLTLIWVTERDGRVCPICRPLHNKPESRWPHERRDGPPAHPRCRCRTVFELRSIAVGGPAQ